MGCSVLSGGLLKNGISIVIPAYNEEKFLPGTLASINAARAVFEQKFSLPSEVIVVDNQSTDGTRAVAESLGAKVIAHEIRNIASVRNAGIREAQFEVVVTVDADNEIPSDAYVKIWEAMQTGRYVGGGVRVRLNTRRLAIRLFVWAGDRLLRVLGGVSCGMFFFWKEAGDAVGGFPEDRMVAEDVAFADRLKKYGKKQGRKFCHLDSVYILTADRKEAGAGVRACFYALKHVLGFRVSRKQLGFWYDPKR